MPQQQLDEQSQKVQQSLHSALLNWAKTNGEAEDYRDNVLLGYHIQQQKAMTVEVISRKLDDRGGGVYQKLRLRFIRWQKECLPM